MGPLHSAWVWAEVCQTARGDGRTAGDGATGDETTPYRLPETALVSISNDQKILSFQMNIFYFSLLKSVLFFPHLSVKNGNKKYTTTTLKWVSNTLTNFG